MRFLPGRAIAGITCLVITFVLALGLRMLEWPCWQNPEYRLGSEMLLATHDAYFWLAGACGFGLAVDHPMAAMLRILSGISGFSPAQLAFWLPPVMASLVAAMVFLWCWLLGSLQAGVAAGLIASIAPGFLARTLLGYYDTDLVTLFFPLAIAIFPAWWTMRFLLSSWPQLYGGSEAGANRVTDSATVGCSWIIMLGMSGLMASWTQEWHSFFPYLVRYNSFLILFLAVLPPRERRAHVAGALAYCFPASLGLTGIIWPLLLIIGSMSSQSKIRDLLLNKWILISACCVSVWFLAQGELFNTLQAQINAYLKHTGDAHISGQSALVFPSVAQSIIEVQDLGFAALFSYFHPWLEAALCGMLGYILIVVRRPAAVFLLPLAALGLLSSRLGGRMVMFGAPVMALGISLCVYWLIEYCLRKWIPVRACGWISCLLLCACLVLPFTDMIPALSQGPSINRRHAAALAHLRNITAQDAMLWLWWDWGYAAQYFARRHTIADGARHGGPSLYLPAAVLATDNARFARQIIRRASLLDNEPGNFFRDMDSNQAQELIERLASPATPLEPGRGRQYVIVSFEMLKLGFWISNFGNWDFVTRRGEGGALSIVPQALAYKLGTGEVRLAASEAAIFPISISVFAETGLTTRNYALEWFASHPNATRAEQQAWLASRRNINFLFNRVTDEKLAVDQNIYNSLMTQLLLCDASDPKIAPYFRLIYDNVFARIYEVLPAPLEGSASADMPD